MKRIGENETVTLYMNVGTVLSLLEKAGLLKAFAKNIGLEDLPDDAQLLSVVLEPGLEPERSKLCLTFQSAGFLPVDRRGIFHKSCIGENHVRELPPVTTWRESEPML